MKTNNKYSMVSVDEESVYGTVPRRAWYKSPWAIASIITVTGAVMVGGLCAAGVIPCKPLMDMPFVKEHHAAQLTNEEIFGSAAPVAGGVQKIVAPHHPVKLWGMRNEFKPMPGAADHTRGGVMDKIQAMIEQDKDKEQNKHDWRSDPLGVVKKMQMSTNHPDGVAPEVKHCYTTENFMGGSSPANCCESSYKQNGIDVKVTSCHLDADSSKGFKEHLNNFVKPLPKELMADASTGTEKVHASPFEQLMKDLNLDSIFSKAFGDAKPISMPLPQLPSLDELIGHITMVDGMAQPHDFGSGLSLMPGINYFLKGKKAEENSAEPMVLDLNVPFECDCEDMVEEGHEHGTGLAGESTIKLDHDMFSMPVPFSFPLNLLPFKLF